MTRRALGRVPLDRLSEARLQAHHAIQALTAFAQALIDPMEDDQHRNFDWDVGVRGFRTRGASEARDTTAVFALEEFEVRLERDDAVLAAITARGATLSGLRVAVERASRECVAGAAGRPAFVVPEFELPDHRVATDDLPLDPDRDALAELASWFTHADLALLRLAERAADRVEIARVWPHHFDLATLMHPDGGSVGVGLSPGDASVPHPYWYVRGYPDGEGSGGGGEGADTDGELPDLELGRWKSEGWTGAILEAPDIVGAGSADDQDAAVDRFLDTVVSTCVRLLA